MSSLLKHCHGEKTHFSRNEKRTFSLSQMNNVELAQTLSWRKNALFEEREKNVPSHNNLRLYLIGRSSNVQYLGFCTAATNRWWCDNNKCPISFLYTF